MDDKQRETIYKFKPNHYDIVAKPAGVIAEIRKPGPVFVMSRITEHDEHWFQIVKADAIQTIGEFNDDIIIQGWRDDYGLYLTW